MISITGNTYPVKDQLKALGGKWDAPNKAWIVPEDKADAARALVVGAGPQKSYSRINRSLSSNRRNCPDISKPCYRCGTYCYGDCSAN
jgi:hypothetical protein